MPDRINPDVQRTQPGQIATGNLGGPTVTSQIGEYRGRQADTTQWGPDVVGGLLSFAEKISKQAWVDQTERTYMEAAQARQLGDSIDSIKANPLLKPFVRGGFQDMDFQLGVAERQAEANRRIADDLKKLPPEKMQEFLREQSRSLWEQTGQGLSAKGRSTALQLQMKSEASLMAAHAQAHAEYLNQQNYEKMSAMVTSKLIGLQALKGGNTQPAVQDLAATLLHVQGELDREQYEPIVTNVLGMMFEDGMFHEADQLFRGGGDGYGITEGWSFDTRAKVAAMRHKAWQKERTKESIETAAEIAQLETAHDQGHVLTADEAAYISDSARAELGNKGLARLMVPKGSTSTSMDKFNASVELYRLRDPRAYNVAGEVNVQEGSDNSYIAYRGAAPDSPLGFLNASLRDDAAHGLVARPMIDDLNRVLTRVTDSADLEVTDYDQEFLNTLAQHFRDSVHTGENSSRLAQIENGLDERFKGLMVAFALDTEGRQLQDVILEWRQNIEAAQVASASNGPINTRAAERINAALEEALEDNTRGGIMAVIARATGMAEERIREGSPDRELLEAAMREELDDVLVSNRATMHLYTNGREKFLIDQVADRVKERTLVLKRDRGWFRNRNALVLLPKAERGKKSFMDIVNTTSDGKMVQHGADAIQRAFQKELPEEPGAELAIFPYAGQLHFQYYTEDGQVLNTGIISPHRIAEHLQVEKEQAFKLEEEAQFGTPVKVHDPASGLDVSLNLTGRNSAGIPAQKVLEMRKRLVRDEGVRKRVYEDITRDETGAVVRKQYALGVGESVREEALQYLQMSLEEDGTISDERITQLLHDSSDKALRGAVQIANQYGIRDTDSIVAIGEMIFQMGLEGAKKFDQTFKHIAIGENYAELVQRSKSWAWTKQTPNRSAAFLKAVKPLYRS